MNKSEAQRRRERDAFKAKRRGSEMVKRDRPQPVLKPSPTLANGPDRDRFNGAWADEQNGARDAAIAEGKDIVRDLQAFRAGLDREEQNLKVQNDRARGGDVSGATKELFKAKRRMDQNADRVFTRSQAFRQRHSR